MQTSGPTAPSQSEGVRTGGECECAADRSEWLCGSTEMRWSLADSCCNPAPPRRHEMTGWGCPSATQSSVTVWPWPTLWERGSTRNSAGTSTPHTDLLTYCIIYKLQDRVKVICWSKVNSSYAISVHLSIIIYSVFLYQAWKLSVELWRRLQNPVWLSGIVVKALTCDSRGREFNSRPFHC